MPKNIHVYLHGGVHPSVATGADLDAAATRDGLPPRMRGETDDDYRARVYRATRDSDEGRWVTIHGTHVMIGKGGKIEKGPAALVGRTEHQAHAAGHRDKAAAHDLAMKGKGEDHPDMPHHQNAAANHRDAATWYTSAHAHAQEGNIKAARRDAHSGELSAQTAERAEAKIGTAQPETPEKPMKHVALHNEAADDVKGSEKHEAEHKRLMGLYGSSKAKWEQEAVNRLIQNNATAAVQSKAQVLHHQALAMSEHAKKTGDANDHARALELARKAIDAHGKAGGVGYAAKQAELHKMAKEHDRAVGKANVEKMKQERAKLKMPLSVNDHRMYARSHKADADAASKRGDSASAEAHKAASELHHKAANALDHTHPDYQGAGGAPISQQAQEASEALGKTKAAAAPGSPAAQAIARMLAKKPGGGGGALDAIAERVAKKTAQGAADQDPKHKD